MFPITLRLNRFGKQFQRKEKTESTASTNNLYFKDIMFFFESDTFIIVTNYIIVDITCFCYCFNIIAYVY